MLYEPPVLGADIGTGDLGIGDLGEDFGDVSLVGDEIGLKVRSSAETVGSTWVGLLFLSEILT